MLLILPWNFLAHSVHCTSQHLVLSLKLEGASHGRMGCSSCLSKTQLLLHRVVPLSLRFSLYLPSLSFFLARFLGAARAAATAACCSGDLGGLECASAAEFTWLGPAPDI
jgi:hypothetical protein